MKSQHDESEGGFEMHSNNNEHQEELFKIISNVVAHVVNETIVYSKYEIFHGDVFQELTSSVNRFGERMDSITEHLGGPPRFYILPDDEEPPVPDNYPEAILREVLGVFRRARQSVLRAHMFMTGIQAFATYPSVLDFAKNDAAKSAFVNQTNSIFWEHAESAYIRLCSYWDRIGQVLNFAYFNIRKYDKDGFNSVMNRIHANSIQMDRALRESGSWKSLRSFQTSEKENGLKWLLERRNLIIHSLHLSPTPVSDYVFKSQFNHLDVSHRKKLRPREPADEVKILLSQLNMICQTFGDFLAVVESSPSHKVDALR